MGVSFWIPITIAAAFLQNVRSALQKHLSASLGTTGATFVRFGYGLPFALVFPLALHTGLGIAWPAPGGVFWGAVCLGGIAQIAATLLLVRSFAYRNFTVGTALSKTEPVQAATFGAVILGDRISGMAVFAILIGIAGVLMVSSARGGGDGGADRRPLDLLRSPAAWLGLGAGTCFAIAAVSFRAASLSIAGPGFVMQAAVTLAATTAIQTGVMLAVMAVMHRAQLAAVARAWRPATLVGLVGVTGSAGWFMAMTLQNVAFVRALGQIELVFTFVASIFIFKERTSAREAGGVVVIGAGIVLLLLFG